MASVLQLLFVACLFVVDADSIRCYCNLPQCSNEQQWCTSKRSCFSEMTTTTNAGLTWHGCQEMLVAQQKRRHCDGRRQAVPLGSNAAPRTAALLTQSRHQRHYSILVCCSSNNCNRPSNDATTTATMSERRRTLPPRRRRINGEMPRVLLTAAASRIERVNAQRPEINEELPQRSTSAAGNQQWLLAVLVLVPLLGLLILSALVCIAVRVLRSDSMHQRQLMEVRRLQTLRVNDLFFHPHFVDKDDESGIESLSDDYCWQAASDAASSIASDLLVERSIDASCRSGRLRAPDALV